MSGGLTADHSRDTQPDQAAPSKELPILESGEDRNRDTIDRPAPISKEQPSWDPFNATPIVEEEGFQYEERPKHPFHSDPVNQPGSLPVPVDAAARSERTVSEDGQFYDAPEEPSDLKDDWVIVSPEPENKTVPVTDEPEPENPPSRPILSILNRPRGSYDFSTPTSVQTKDVSQPAPLVAQSISQEQAFPQQRPSQQESESPSKTSFLPPVRRISTFGIGFGSRYAKSRFPLDDDEPDVPQPETESVQSRLNEQNSDRHAAELGALAAAASLAGGVNHESHRGTEQRTAVAEPAGQTSGERELSSTPDQRSPSRPPLIPASSSEYSEHSQQTVIPQKEQEQPHSPFNTLHTSDVIPDPAESIRSPQQQLSESSIGDVQAAELKQPAEGFRSSQDSWRPNVATPPSQASTNKFEDDNFPHQRYPLEAIRPSLEHSRTRGNSGSGSFTQRPEGSYDQRLPRPPSFQQPKIFDQPPSSAQRYPGLFQPQQSEAGTPKDDVDLPAHYYQAPLPREEVFLPRQQTNEYQLPGVGPPVDEPRSAGSRRNSNFFRELGGKISRGTSRERGTSRDGGIPSPGRPVDTRGEREESSVASEEAKGQTKRRSSFLGYRSGASTGGLGSPQSGESMVTHNAGSRADLVTSPAPSPITKHDRKRSFFGSFSGEPTTKQNKLSRASTTHVDASGKKKRFSGLSGFFGKSGQRESRESTPERPQATRELSHNERQPLESPLFDPRQAVHAASPKPTPSNHTRAPSQQRQPLSKVSSNVSSPSESPRQSSRSRRPSLLSGILGGRRSHQQEGDQISFSSESRPVAQHVAPTQAHTNLQGQQQRQNVPQQHQPAPIIPWQDATRQPPDRGRRASREPQVEPQYSSVPIPGGYGFVRGQGSMTAPMQYDPRSQNGLQQSDSRSPYAEQKMQNPYEQRRTSLTSPLQQYPIPRSQGSANRRPSQTNSINVGAPDSHQNGRSHPFGEDIEVSPPSTRSPVSQSQNDTIQHLHQPIVRHTQSPAGYPLPDDSVLSPSPINPHARGFPPPPPPKSSSRGSVGANANASQHSSRLTAEQDLDRSNTHRTAVSSLSHVSGFSGEYGQEGSLSVPQREAGRGNEGRRVSSLSPTPPSVLTTPDNRESPFPRPQMHPQDLTGDGERIKTTVLNRDPSPDLYDASPRQSRGKGIESVTNRGPHSNSSTEQELERQRILDHAREEKIYYGEGGVNMDEEDSEPSMSATSYPGQEWNPYVGVYEDGYD